jgi:Tol biopolymer transport system component
MNPVTAPDERVSWTLWSPDGSRVAYSTLVAGGGSSIRNADGTGNAEHLEGVDGNLSSWSRDDRIALVRGTPATGADIWVVDLKTPDRRPQPILQTTAEERFPAFSPDGKWLAYVSDESGRPDVYIQPFPGPGPRVLVSPAGGIAPAWRGDGAELFYTVNTGGVSMHAVSITATSSGLSVGAPRRLFDGQYASGTPARGYDVTADGQRFVFARTVSSRPPPSPQMVLVENWFEELRRLAPAGR